MALNGVLGGGQVVFQVDCAITKPGDELFATGGHDVLGQWAPDKGLKLDTTKETFPTWSSQPVSVPADVRLEYKFVIKSAKTDPRPFATWEAFEGNRDLVSKAGLKQTARSIWGKKVDTRVSSEALPEALGGQNGTKQAPAKGGLAAQPRISMADALKLADQIEQREPRRKNFSQSLITLDVEDAGAASQALSAAAEMPAQEPEQAGQECAGATPAMRKTMPLKHITSLSALSEMADIMEKEEARATTQRVATYESQNLDVPVVIVTSEIAPYSKTGGLGLVAASYSYEFARKGHRTMAISPKYKHYDGLTYVAEAKVMVADREEVVKYWHKHEGGCDYVFVEHPSIEKDGGLYNSDDGREYPDNLFRFTLLSLAALEAPLILKLNGKEVYGQKCLFLANDWQAGLVPLYLCYKYRPNNCYVESRVIYVVHNLGYQGQYPHIKACHFFGIPELAAADIGLGDSVNLCKGALVCADRVITVSPNYTKEVQTAAGGFRLESFVKAKGDALRLGGILNGIDDCWNPEIDKNIEKRYSIENFETGKRFNKAALQKAVGLQVDERAVLVGFVGRLTWQKGVDVMVSILDWLMKDEGNGVTGHVQLIMMGNGEKQYADALRGAEGRHPGRVCGYVGFDPKVEHHMMAGCDLFLMPSRYEPCGLPQMYSQRYGTLPIVTATGGLVDSVKDVALGCDKATGFHISVLEEGKMKEVIYRACALCLQAPADFKKMIVNAMSEDFYWPQAMDEYEKSIDQTLSDPAIHRS